MFTQRAAVLLFLGGAGLTAAAVPGFRGSEIGLRQQQTDPLTLEQAIDMALENNLDALVDRTGVTIARDRVRYAWGAFDPIFAVNTTRGTTQTPQNATNITTAAELQQVTLEQQTLDAERQLVLANQELAQQIALANGQPAPVFAATPNSAISNFANEPPLIFESQTFNVDSQLQGKTPIGTTYTLGLQVQRLAPLIENVGRQFVTEDSAAASITLQQPLLRDFGPAANMAEVRINRSGQKVANFTWRQSVMNAVQTVITTYYDMVYALDSVRVREEAIAADQRLVQGNQARLDVGLMSPIDVRQAQVAVSEDQENLITAKNLFMERQFALKRAILRDSRSDDGRIFIPVHITPPRRPGLEPAEWKRVAFEKRLDYLSALEQAQAEDIRLRFARNQMLPKLDLVASYGLNGLTQDFGSAVTNAFNGQAHSFSVGVVASVPLFNMEGRAQLQIAKGLKEQALLKIKQTELTIDVDIDTIISRIQTNLQRVETARESRRLGDEAMKIQNKRIEEGQVSSFDIIDTQKRLFDARTRELSAQGELDKSIVQLYFAAGTLLEQQHLVLADPLAQPRVR